MLKIIKPERAERILAEFEPLIAGLSERYRFPSELLQAVLFREMTMTDVLDPAADLVVAAGIFPKKDSSTGFGQVFGRTAINAINAAVAAGLTGFAALGLPERILDADDPHDVRKVWLKLWLEPAFNIEAAALTLLDAARQMTGRRDFDSFSEEELKLILTRYNSDTRTVSAYGQAVYEDYLSRVKKRDRTAIRPAAKHVE